MSSSKNCGNTDFAEGIHTLKEGLEEVHLQSVDGSITGISVPENSDVPMMVSDKSPEKSLDDQISTALVSHSMSPKNLTTYIPPSSLKYNPLFSASDIENISTTDLNPMDHGFSVSMQLEAAHSFLKPNPSSLSLLNRSSSGLSIFCGS